MRLSLNLFFSSQIFSDTNGTKLANRRYHFDPQHLVPIANKEMVSFLKDGMIEDWELFEKMLNHIYKDHIRDKADCHPVLMSEPPVSIFSQKKLLGTIIFIMILALFAWRDFLGKPYWKTTFYKKKVDLWIEIIAFLVAKSIL